MLHILAEIVLANHDTLLSAGNFNDYPINHLRLSPAGFDAVGNIYWYFGDRERLYREPSQKTREQVEKRSRAAKQAIEKQVHQQAKEHKRQAALLKREQQQIRRQQRKQRNAEKWAPRVAASRTTRASKRAQQSIPFQPPKQTAPDEALPSRSSARKRYPSTKAEDTTASMSVSASSRHINRNSSSAEEELAPEQAVHLDAETVTSKSSARACKPHMKTLAQRSSKRPRTSEMAYMDPELRNCKSWETLTTDATSLCDLIDRFKKDEATTAERSLVQNLSEHVLPQIEEHESKIKKEAERKQRTQYLMMNQKRSSRVQAIAERKEMEARHAAQKEETLRLEEERLALHHAKLYKLLSLAEREQSREIRTTRRQFGVVEALARDEESVKKIEAAASASKDVVNVRVRRSSRGTKGSRVKSELSVEILANGRKDEEVPTAEIKKECDAEGHIEPVTEAEKGVPNLNVHSKQQELVPSSDTGQDGSKILATKQTGTVENKEIDNGENGVAATSGKREEYADKATARAEGESIVPNGRTVESAKPQKYSSGALEEAVVGKYEWEYSKEDGLPMRVLDRFFFAFRSDFRDAPLEQCEMRGSEMVGIGVLLPPETSEAEVCRVELPKILDWVIEYGGEPKLWVKTDKAWYELRQAGIEYQDTFSTARRKFEVCARIGIIGETMRGAQLSYDSIVGYLSMRYGNMKAYSEAEILEEKEFIIGQVESLNRRGLLQSGFVKVLRKKMRAEQRKLMGAGGKWKRSSHGTKMDKEVGGVEGEQKGEKATKGSDEVVDLKVAARPGAKTNGKKGTMKKSGKKKGGGGGKDSAVRVVGSIVASLLKAATKSAKTKTSRKRKRNGGEDGERKVARKTGSKALYKGATSGVKANGDGEHTPMKTSTTAGGFI